MRVFSLALVLLALLLSAAAIEILVDNVSPEIIFSPLPCYQISVQGCSIEWRLHDSPSAFNGSVTRTTGQDPSQNLTLLPRASLLFQGTDILFMPGMHSTAQASVVVDDRASVLVNTSRAAFAGVGLDPTQNHTITVQFVPSTQETVLDVDYFLISQPDEISTSTPTPSTSSSFFTTALPTSLPLPTNSQIPFGTLAQPSVPVGTIAAVSLSGAIILVLAFLLCFFAVRRRRRREALRRERAILHDLHLPSTRRRMSKAVEYRHDLESANPREEKGKARADSFARTQQSDFEWRIATPLSSLRFGRAPGSDRSTRT